MNFTNKHIILIILTIIILAFIYSYDVYIVEKNQPICKPIYVTKRILTPDAEELLVNNGVSQLKEGMDLIDDEIIEGFGTLMGQGTPGQTMNQTLNNIAETGNMNTPGQTLSTFTVSGVTDKKKVKVMDSVIKVLANIPTNLEVNIIKQMVEYFAMIYQTSSTLGIFYQNVASSTKIKDAPYNTKYAQLVLFLIGKFNNDVEGCIERPQNECGYISDSDIKPENIQPIKPEHFNSIETNSEKLPQYLQEAKCETCVMKPESINKLLPEIINKIIPQVSHEISNEIIHDVTQEITNEITQEIKNMYPRPEYRPEYRPEIIQEKQPQSIISEIIDRIIPNNNKSCSACSSTCKSPPYLSCPSCPSNPNPNPNPNSYPNSYPSPNPYPNPYPNSYQESEQGTSPKNNPSNYPGNNPSNYPGNYPGNKPYSGTESEKTYRPTRPTRPARPGYPGIIPEQENPFNDFPGEFNPPPQRNIQKNKPCTDKCKVQCSTSGLSSRAKYMEREGFDNVQSWDAGTDYYSLLN